MENQENVDLVRPHIFDALAKEQEVILDRIREYSHRQAIAWRKECDECLIDDFMRRTFPHLPSQTRAAAIKELSEKDRSLVLSKAERRYQKLALFYGGWFLGSLGMIPLFISILLIGSPSVLVSMLGFGGLAAAIISSARSLCCDLNWWQCMNILRRKQKA